MIFALLIAAVAPGTYSVDPAASTLRYVVTHKLHEVDATSKEVEGKALAKPDGSVLTEVRAAVASFKSGDGNRDEHMMEALEVGTYPFVVFKGIAQRQTDRQMDGEIDLHGVKKSISFPAEIQTSADAVMVKAEFAINRRDFNVNYPGMPNDLIRDNVIIKLDLKATPGAARPEDQLALR